MMAEKLKANFYVLITICVLNEKNDAMDEEFSSSPINLIQVRLQAGALMRPKEMRSGPRVKSQI